MTGDLTNQWLVKIDSTVLSVVRIMRFILRNSTLNYEGTMYFYYFAFEREKILENLTYWL